MVGSVEGILGMRPDFYGLRIAPSIPAEWDGFTVRRISAESISIIEVKNPGHAESGFKSMEINGQTIFNNYVKDEWLMSNGDNIITLYMS